MTQLVYGRMKQLTFQSEEDLYTSIGFLANANIRIYTEDNDINLSGGEGAWANEWRMSFASIPNNTPPSIKSSIKPNKDGSNPRLNNKEFINDLLKTKHGFQLGDNQNIPNIRKTIPSDFIIYFENGVAL
jgi:hypothetical protein